MWQEVYWQGKIRRVNFEKRKLKDKEYVKRNSKGEKLLVYIKCQ